jgi:hypothetical protein
MCVVCNESISDPVCRGCYLKQINLLLNDMQMHILAKKIILNKIKNSFPIETLNNTECILCRKDNVAICRYCFSIILRNILREFNFTEEMIEDFGYTPMHEENSLESESILEIKG